MAASDFEAYVDTLIAALRTPLTDEQLRASLSAPYSDPHFKATPIEDLRDVNRALRTAAEALPELDPFDACRLGYVIGVFVEEGADANHVARDLVQCLARLLREVRPLSDREDPELEGIEDPRAYLDSDPLAARALLGLRDLSLAVMTSLCRAQRSRVEVRGWSEFREDLANIAFPNAWYIEELLDCVDDLELTVLHPQQGRGYKVVAQAVRRNFHLFSLLQAELIGEKRDGWLEGPPTDPAMRAYARGETHVRPSDTDFAAWHFGSWRSWTRAGFVAEIGSTLLLGEMSPRDVPELDGHRYVILGQLDSSRSWDANFLASLHDAHEPRLWVQNLTKGEVARHLETIAEANEG